MEWQLGYLAHVVCTLVLYILYDIVQANLQG